MKQLTLFLLLTLFIISCGDDSTIGVKSDIIPLDKSKPLYVLEEGHPLYYEYIVSREKSDTTYKSCVEYIFKGTYEYENEPVNVYQETFRYIDADSTYNLGYYFRYKDYIFRTVSSKLSKGKITEARIFLMNNIKKDGRYILNDTEIYVTMDEFELDGIIYEAWKIVVEPEHDGIDIWFKYIPGIGMVESYNEQDDRLIEKQKLYKYELN